jgi:hypothetical protein
MVANRPPLRQVLFGAFALGFGAQLLLAGIAVTVGLLELDIVLNPLTTLVLAALSFPLVSKYMK